MKLLIHSKTSKVQSLKFVNEYAIVSHVYWLHNDDEIKANPFSKSGTIIYTRGVRSIVYLWGALCLAIP